MRDLPVHPRAAALAGFLLALPFMALVLCVLTGTQPSLGPLDPLLDPEVSHLGSFIFLGAAFLALAGLIVCSAVIVGDLRAGKGPAAHLGPLVVAVVILVFLIAVASAVIADQYPCWAGAPNCD
jgi:hypothetical protein